MRALLLLLSTLLVFLLGIDACQVETCDGIDNDGDGKIDEGFDQDGDGYLDADACAGAYPPEQLDCDDANPAIHPGAVEVCEAEGTAPLDNDCDGLVDSADPDTAELCDGNDNDCDGAVDEGLDASWHRDADQDRYGAPDDVIDGTCAAPEGYVLRTGDCDDSDPRINPAAPELPNGADDDCDGRVDEAWNALSAGWDHSLAIRGDRTLWVWGENRSGELGLGIYDEFKSSPTLLSSLSGVVAVAGGCCHSLAVLADGIAWSWGDNDHYQLGSGGTWDARTPVRVDGPPDIVAIAAGNVHSLFLTSRGEVWTSGTNQQAEDDTPLLSPWRVEGLPEVVAIFAGPYSQLSFFIDADGQLWSWDHGGVAPEPVEALEEVVAVAPGRDFNLALDRAGRVWAWGVNYSGQLGDGTTVDRDVPALVAGIDDVVAIAAGLAHGAALGADGRTWVWGSNDEAELGAGIQTNMETVARVVPGLEGAWAVTAGGENTQVLLLSGEGRSWGDNYWGQLGIGVRDMIATPTVTRLDPASGSSVIGTGSLGIALTGLGQLSTWGWAGAELGDGSSISRYEPAVIDGIDAAISVDAQWTHALVADTGGTVWAWGSNEYGELGDGTTESRSTPVEVIGLAGAQQVAAGTDHSVALDTFGHVWAWGRNAQGQLGDGSYEDRHTPVQVAAPGTVRAVDAGVDYTLALFEDGSVWAWGGNSCGQLGNGTTVGSPVPIRVAGLPFIVSIAAGGSSFALDRDGLIWAWGSNDQGELGIGTGPYVVTTPTRVEGACDAVDVAVGSAHTVAACRDGRVMAWGYGVYGQLGNGIYTWEYYPVEAIGVEDAYRVAAGGHCSYAATTTGPVYGWGDSSNGQLAINPGWSPLPIAFPR